MKAILSNYRQSPRKVRLIADLVRGKNVNNAITVLSHVKKRAAQPFKKLIESAVSNAKTQGINKDNLVIKEIKVDKGFTFKRFRARARGRASSIHKHTSNVMIKLEDKVASKETKEKSKKK